MKKKIAIIGAGLAGLTIANFLKKDSSFEFMVYEKNDSISLEEGYGIQLANNSVSVLNKINFSKISSENFYNPKSLDFYTIKNEKISSLNISQFNTEQTKYTTLKRSTLIEFLKDEIYSQHLRFGKKIKEVKEIKDKILLKFSDNTNDLVDYVVGADGAFSSTRSFFHSQWKKPIFKKAIAIRTIIRADQNIKINENNISLLLGSNTHLVIYPINKKKELNFVCIIRSKKYEPDNIRQLIERSIYPQNSSLKNLFNTNIKSWPLYASSEITPSFNNKVFYIGDAFNSFLPTFAQGAGQSIESAHELYNSFKDKNTNFSDIYFKSRSKRIKSIRKRSDLNFFLFHFSSSLMQKIRNFFLQFLLKKKNFINIYIGKIYKN